jgi:hypothetical protein
MTYWGHPPIEKVIEALGAIADDRVEMMENTAKVTSSSRGKYYEVRYDPVSKALMANDNLSYYKDMLGYPGVAFLMMKGVLQYDEGILPLVRGVPWKDLNTKYKGNFRKTLETVLEKLSSEDAEFLQDEALRIHTELLTLKIPILGDKIPPPEGY